MKKLVSLLVALLVIPFSAQAADVKGSSDHPLIKRYEGAQIKEYKKSDFDRYVISPQGADGKAAEPMVLEGEVTYIEYFIESTPQKVHSLIEVLRNYENALQTAGFELQKSLRPKETHYNSEIGMSLYPQRPERRYGVLMQQDGPLYVEVIVGQATLRKDNIRVAVAVIKPKPMADRMVAPIVASDLAKAIQAQGKIDIYGIYFDFNKADIKPESEPTLKEIAALLQSDAALKLTIAGHTDNLGTKDYNDKLSLIRAQSVVEWLVAQGIDRTRLSAEGKGFAEPVASNADELGRAKNRRVELKRM